MTNQETVLAFIRSINARDAHGLGELMSDDHRFIDALGNEIVGKERMISGCRGYFEWFPDYWIEVNEVFAAEASEGEQTFAMFGFPGGSFKASSDASWRIRAAWKAIVTPGRNAVSRAFADTNSRFQ